MEDRFSLGNLALRGALFAALALAFHAQPAIVFDHATTFDLMRPYVALASSVAAFVLVATLWPKARVLERCLFGFCLLWALLAGFAATSFLM